jgi:hypothetical protein
MSEVKVEPNVEYAEVTFINSKLPRKPEPVVKFEDLEEAYGCLEYWKKKLFLTDWTIKLNLVEGTLKMEDDREAEGKNNYVFMRKASLITLGLVTEDREEYVERMSQEQALVHELLHLKYNWQIIENDHTGRFYDEMEHQLLEEMAKSLIMVKYSLDFDWFKNF